ncbi:MAG: hypothetical protein K0Q83_3352 [Deltaproteobacteria bacterium]|nr:hypothetical protein [Deltaproteobacteria bacterium]
MSGAIAAAHHPSIFASVRPATKTAFLLIKDSPPFFFRLFFSYRNDDDTGQLTEGREIRGFFPQAKAQRSGKQERLKHSGFFLISPRRCSRALTKTEYGIRPSRRKIKVGISRTAEIKTILTSPTSVSAVFQLTVRHWCLHTRRQRLFPSSQRRERPLPLSLFALFAGKSPRRVCATPWSAHPSIF